MYTPEITGQQPPGKAVMLGYVTDRRQFAGSPGEQERKLLDKIGECAAAGLDWVQLREKDLSSRGLLELARKAATRLPPGSATRLLVNARIDVALAAGAGGIHLPANDLPASEARAIWDRAGKTPAVIGVSVHTPEETALAEAHGADFAVFAPVFEKDGRANPQGVAQLRAACARQRRGGAFMPVLALGGVSLENANRCFAAGASGVAAIRLFQENSVESVAHRLRLLFVEAQRLKPGA